MKKRYPCICGETHLKKKYADLHTQQTLNRINRNNDGVCDE